MDRINRDKIIEYIERLDESTSLYFFMYGVGYICFLTTSNFTTIFKLMSVLFLFFTSGTLSFAAVAYITQSGNYLAPEDEEDDDDIKRLLFLNGNYEELYHAQKELENKEDDQEEKDLSELKKEENYYKRKLDFMDNEVIFFYNHENDTFSYYTRTGDLVYNYLNALTREYVLKHNCVELYTDEGDIKFMEETYGEKKEDDEEDEENDKDNEEEDVENVEKENENKEKRIESFEDINKDNEEVQEKQGENPGLFGGLFHFKNKNKNNDNEDKKDTVPKRKQLIEKKINKYIRLGSIHDYEYEKSKNEKNTGMENMDYKTFMKSKKED